MEGQEGNSISVLALMSEGGAIFIAGIGAELDCWYIPRRPHARHNRDTATVVQLWGGIAETT